MCCRKTRRCKKRIWALSKRRSATGLAALCLGIAFLIAACQSDTLNCEDPLGCVVVRPNSPLRFATLLPASGDTAVWGQELSRGIDLAVMEQGEELLDHEIELVPLDSACDAETGVQALQSLGADASLLGLIGPACSDVATAVLPIVRRNNWLMISPASSLPSLTMNQSEPLFFRTVPNHLHQATVAAHFAYEQLNARQAAVFQDGTSYNSLLAQQFNTTFIDLGGVISYQGTLSAGQSDLGGMLAELSVNPPDVVYLALFEPEANLLVNRLTEIDELNSARMVGGDGLLTSTFASRVGSAANGMYITGPLLSSDAYNAFLAQWAIRYETPPTSPGAAYAYDAAQLLFAAVEDAAVVGQDGSLVIGRAALRASVAGSQAVEGLTGSLTCDENGECATQSYGVYLLDSAVLNDNGWPPPLAWEFK